MMLRMLHRSSGRQNFDQVKETKPNPANEEPNNTNQSELAKKTEAAIQEANRKPAETEPKPSETK